MDGRPGPNTRDYKRPRALNVTWSLRQAQFLKLSLDFHGRYIYICIYMYIYGSNNGYESFLGNPDLWNEWITYQDRIRGLILTYWEGISKWPGTRVDPGIWDPGFDDFDGRPSRRYPTPAPTTLWMAIPVLMKERIEGPGDREDIPT